MTKKKILIYFAVLSLTLLLLSLFFCLQIDCRVGTAKFWQAFVIENLYGIVYIGIVSLMFYRDSRLTLSFLLGGIVMVVAYNVESFDKGEGLYIYALLTLWLMIRVIWYSEMQNLMARCRALKIIFLSLIYLFLFLLISAYSVNAACALAPVSEEADYAIVLGAPVLDDRASDILNDRVETAAEYLRKDKNCRVILTGGFHTESQRSEAEIIYDGLVKSGIAPERMILDFEAKSTLENFEHAIEIIELSGGSREDRVTIITSEFHTLRSGILAKHYGLTNVSFMKAKSFSMKDYVWYAREVPTLYATLFKYILD